MQPRDRQLLIGAAIVVALLIAATAMVLPMAQSVIAEQFTPGLGMKNAAVIAFFVTVVTLVIFAIAAGDGLLGELQYMIGGFGGFFIVLWLMIAWIF